MALMGSGGSSRGFKRNKHRVRPAEEAEEAEVDMPVPLMFPRVIADPKTGEVKEYSIPYRVFVTLEDPSSSTLAKGASLFIMLVIVLSCMSYIFATDPAHKAPPDGCPDCEPRPARPFNIIETFSIIVFSVEYILRVGTVSFVPISISGLKPSEKAEEPDMRAASPGSSSVRSNSRTGSFRGRKGSILKHLPSSLGPPPAKEMPGWKKIIKYVMTPMNVIDLVAILPFYAEVIFPSSEAGLSFVRVLRLARVFRIFKLGKYNEGMQLIGRTLKASMPALSLLFFFTLIGIVLFGSLIYFMEGGNWHTFDDDEGEYPNGAYYRPNLRGDDVEVSPFISIPACFYWVVVTTTTVGYGELYPTTVGGKVVACVCMYCGIMVLALPITVLGSNFSREYQMMHDDESMYPWFDDDDEEDEDIAAGADAEGNGQDDTPPKLQDGPGMMGLPSGGAGDDDIVKPLGPNLSSDGDEAPATGGTESSDAQGGDGPPSVSGGSDMSPVAASGGGGGLGSFAALAKAAAASSQAESNAVGGESKSLANIVNVASAKQELAASRKKKSPARRPGGQMMASARFMTPQNAMNNQANMMMMNRQMGKIVRKEVQRAIAEQMGEGVSAGSTPLFADGTPIGHSFSTESGIGPTGPSLGEQLAQIRNVLASIQEQLTAMSIKGSASVHSRVQAMLSSPASSDSQHDEGARRPNSSPPPEYARGEPPGPLGELGDGAEASISQTIAGKRDMPTGRAQHVYEYSAADAGKTVERGSGQLPAEVFVLAASAKDEAGEADQQTHDERKISQQQKRHRRRRRRPSSSNRACGSSDAPVSDSETGASYADTEVDDEVDGGLRYVSDPAERDQVLKDWASEDMSDGLQINTVTEAEVVTTTETNHGDGAPSAAARLRALGRTCRLSHMAKLRSGSTEKDPSGTRTLRVTVLSLSGLPKSLVGGGHAAARVELRAGSQSRSTATVSVAAVESPGPSSFEARRSVTGGEVSFEAERHFDFCVPVAPATGLPMLRHVAAHVYAGENAARDAGMAVLPIGQVNGQVHELRLISRDTSYDKLHSVNLARMGRLRVRMEWQRPVSASHAFSTSLARLLVLGGHWADSPRAFRASPTLVAQRTEASEPTVVGSKSTTHIKSPVSPLSLRTLEPGAAEVIPFDQTRHMKQGAEDSCRTTFKAGPGSDGACCVGTRSSATGEVTGLEHLSSRTEEVKSPQHYCDSDTLQGSSNGRSWVEKRRQTVELLGRETTDFVAIGGDSHTKDGALPRGYAIKQPFADRRTDEGRGEHDGGYETEEAEVHSLTDTGSASGDTQRRDSRSSMCSLESASSSSYVASHGCAGKEMMGRGTGLPPRLKPTPSTGAVLSSR